MILSDNDDSSSENSLDNLKFDINEDLQIIDESFDEEEILNVERWGAEEEVEEIHDTSNNFISL